MTNQPEERLYLDEALAEYEKDAEFVAMGLALDLTEDAAKVMAERKMTRAQLADLMGLSRARVTQILNAPANLTLKSIAQLAIALNVKPVVRLQDPRMYAGATMMDAMFFDAATSRFRHILEQSAVTLEDTSAWTWTRSSPSTFPENFVSSLVASGTSAIRTPSTQSTSTRLSTAA